MRSQNPRWAIHHLRASYWLKEALYQLHCMMMSPQSYTVGARISPPSDIFFRTWRHLFLTAKPHHRLPVFSCLSLTQNKWPYHASSRREPAAFQLTILYSLMLIYILSLYLIIALFFNKSLTSPKIFFLALRVFQSESSHGIFCPLVAGAFFSSG